MKPLKGKKTRLPPRKESRAMLVRKFFRKLVRNLLCLVAGLSAFAACAYTDYRLWPLDLQAPRYPAFPAPAIQGNRLVLPFTPGVASAEVASFNDQLEAFLRFEYLRGREAREGHDTSRIFLTALDSPKGPSYKIFIVTDNDLLTAVPQLGQLESRNLIAHYEFATWTPKDFSYYQQQSHIFDVAHFYSLPLDYFLGVGAMENDYMDVNGDLTHAVWKKRAQRGDIVLRRTRKRVMVSDYAIGTWQITRETLRAAHVLYLKDKRDYNLLPARLRPPRELDVNSVSDAVLTTYAGLLLRDLLDHFGGNVDKAIGAYNGGVKTPNPAYASGVKTVADYARRILEHASALDDPSANANGPAKSQSAPSAAPPPNAPQQKHPWRRADD